MCPKPWVTNGAYIAPVPTLDWLVCAEPQSKKHNGFIHSIRYLYMYFLHYVFLLEFTNWMCSASS